MATTAKGSAETDSAKPQREQSTKPIDERASDQWKPTQNQTADPESEEEWWDDEDHDAEDEQRSESYFPPQPKQNAAKDDYKQGRETQAYTKEGDDRGDRVAQRHAQTREDTRDKGDAEAQPTEGDDEDERHAQARPREEDTTDKRHSQTQPREEDTTDKRHSQTQPREEDTTDKRHAQARPREEDTTDERHARAQPREEDARDTERAQAQPMKRDARDDRHAQEQPTYGDVKDEHSSENAKDDHITGRHSQTQVNNDNIQDDRITGRHSQTQVNNDNTQDDRLPESYFHQNLFQADNTGTKKYKNLLRGLKNIINKHYEPTESSDLMPGQLAKYYRDLNGDYNQLFLKTPSPSISFIYRSLGCPYSLQPRPAAQKVEEPEIPALKTEGWIMWSTIQMLLGPEEHAGFLIEAVKRWDVVDPETGKMFPKTLPRDSLPAVADPRMSDWYQGVSERLKKEAEEEAETRNRQHEIQRHAENRRVAVRRDDEGDNVDSRGPALAYFRNPLYRHGDGRPSIVRKSSNRPNPSPKQSISDKGKEAITTVGHVIRNVASPHLWDGNNGRDKRRRSVPDSRYHHPSEPAPQGVPREERLPGPGPQQDKRRSQHRPESSPEAEIEGDVEREQRPRPKKEDRDHSLRHSRSHEPTPSQREYEDYFQQDESHHGSAQDDMKQPPIGPSFTPSSALPFAAQVALQQPEGSRTRRQPEGNPPRKVRYDDADNDASAGKRSRSRFDNRPPNEERSRFDDRAPNEERSRQDGRAANDDRRRRNDERPDDRQRYDDRPHDQRPRREDRPSNDDRHRHNQRQDDRHHHHHRRARSSHDERSRHDERPRHDRPAHDERPRNDERRAHNDRRAPHAGRASDYRQAPDGRRAPDDRRDYDDRSRQDSSPDPRRLSGGGHGRSDSRPNGGSDLEAGADEGDRRNRKQTRFATEPISGVDGRRYIDQFPWQSQS